MDHPVTGIDHVFLFVADLDASRDAYARLGFTLSPRGLHSAHKGTANHTIMFADTYFELLGVVAETEGNADRREMLARAGEGLHAVACRIADARAAEAALAERGIRTGARSAFARPVALPEGGEGEAAFETLPFAPEEVPAGIGFMCQHLTPELVWVPSLLRHENGAYGLDGAIAAHPDPEAAARRFARLFRDGVVLPVDGGARVATGEASPPLTMLAPAALAARYPGFHLDRTARGAFAVLRVAVRDLSALGDLLAGRGVSARPTADGVAVAPEDASGVILEFVP